MRPCMRGDMRLYADQRRAAIFQPAQPEGEMMMGTLKSLAAEMFRSTLESAGVAPDKIAHIVERMVDEHFPTAQGVSPIGDIEPEEEPTVDFDSMVATVKVRP